MMLNLNCRKATTGAIQPIKATATATPPTVPSKAYTFAFLLTGGHLCFMCFDNLYPMFN